MGLIFLYGIHFLRQVDVLIKAKIIVKVMTRKTKVVDHKDGPRVPEKTLFAVK